MPICLSGANTVDLVKLSRCRGLFRGVMCLRDCVLAVRSLRADVSNRRRPYLLQDAASLPSLPRAKHGVMVGFPFNSLPGCPCGFLGL